MSREDFIRDQIRRILFEDKAQGGVQQGRVGKGGLSVTIRSASALAKKNPEALMKKLGISGASGSTSIEKVRSVLSQAISYLKSDDAKKHGLQGAYSSVYEVSSSNNQKSGENYLRIEPGEISEREAALYAVHILVGAVSSGILAGLDKKVTPTLEDGKAVIKFSDPS